MVLHKLDFEDAAGLRWFLDRGVDVNAHCCLHHAIVRGRGLGIITMLLDAGADPNLPWTRWDVGRRPLDQAAMYGRCWRPAHHPALGDDRHRRDRRAVRHLHGQSLSALRYGGGMDLDRAVLEAQLAARRVTAAVVRRLPVPVAERLRRPVTAAPGSVRRRAQEALLQVLRRGGIPAAVRTFRLGDHPELAFVNAESLVLHQLYWFGEQGWEPQLLPWWLRCCRRSSAILELGANVGYFTVQGAKAAPRARYLAVEPYPPSADVCRSNLELNHVQSVELITAAAVAEAEQPAVQLQIPSDQLVSPSVAFLGAGTELPERMRRGVTRTVLVPAVDVRSLLTGIDLFKLDVEGQEHALLGASRQHLRTRRPTVFVEVLPGTHRLRQLLADLCRHDGFRCYVPQADSLVQLDPADLLDTPLLDRYGCQDVILTPEPHLV